MIKIDKSGKRPNITFKKGDNKGKDKLVEARLELIKEFKKDPEAYKKDEKKLASDGGLYAHEEVKKNLIDLQNGKCCFCESKITHIAYGDVEHFRPKAAYRKAKGEDLIYPGYFWLAYDWDNLFLSCQLCNQRYKENLFLLEDETTRFQTYKDDWRQEKETFIHPELDNPEDHITFEEAFIKAKTKRGEKTIEALGLERSELFEFRNMIFQLIEQLVTMYKGIPKGFEEAAKNELLKILPKYMDKSAQYSSMFKANFSDFFKELQKEV